MRHLRSWLAIPRAIGAIATLFITAGVLHFVVPEPFMRIVPPALPRPRELVYISGLCEIVGGLAVLPRQTRRAAGWGLIALLWAVFPANIEMWLSARAAAGPRWQEIVLLLRLPLQWALMWWIWRATQGAADPAIQRSQAG